MNIRTRRVIRVYVDFMKIRFAWSISLRHCSVMDTSGQGCHPSKITLTTNPSCAEYPGAVVS